MAAEPGAGRRAGKGWLLAAFLLCALPLGMICAVLTPPGRAPDEPTHVARAAGLLHGAVFAVRKEVTNKKTGRRVLSAGVKVNRGLYRAGFGITTPIDGRTVVTAPDFVAQRAKPTMNQMVSAGIPNTAQYFPAPYVPAALAMGAARAVGAPTSLGFLAARLAMLAAYLALGAASLWVAGWGEALLLSVLILPMTVFLAGSINSDGVLIALACLGVACLTRAGARFRVTGLVCLALLLGSKVTDFPILALAVLPLAPAGWWRRVRDAAFAAAPVALWWGLVIAFVSVQFYMPQYRPGPLYLGDPAAARYGTDPAGNFHILLHPATRLLSLPAVTLWDGGRETLREMIGVLGGLQIMFPVGFYIAWGVALAIAAGGVALGRRAGGPALRECLFVLALMAAIYWLTQITEYIDWSPAGTDRVQGMQGRYLLPVLPMLLFAIPRLRRGANLPRWLPALPAILLGIVDLAYVPVKLVNFFYLH
jgi:hypothetical protein